MMTVQWMKNYSGASREGNSKAKKYET